MIVVGGETRKARSLTLQQWREACALDAYGADLASVAYGYGLTREQAQEWLDSHTVREALTAIGAVMVASGLVEEAQFPDAASDDAGGERSGV